MSTFPTKAIIAKQKLTELQRAILQLTILAFFFAMHSCEYVKVQQHKKWRTKILCLRNLRFFKNGRLFDHNDPSLKYANCINITFKMQKKDQKNDTTTQMASGDVTLCPVQAATAIVRQIRSYPGANEDRHGARLRGSKSNAVNLILRLFLYHFVHTMSSWCHESIHNNTNNQQTPPPWWWSHSPLQQRGFDESMPSEWWAALRIYFPRSLSKGFGRINKLM